MHRIVYVFFFLSGLSSLVFEVIWERMLVDVFGSTSFALGTLLAVFMGGMGLGSAIGGRFADEIDDQLRLYGGLEGFIGIYALVVPYLLDLLPILYSAMFDFYIQNYLLFSLLRFAVTIVFLIAPTICMGATLPLLSQWISEREHLFEGSISGLYGINTIGACCGCLTAGFILLPNLGLSTTNYIFAAVNVGLALFIWTVTSQFSLEPAADTDFEDDESEDQLPGLETVVGSPTLKKSISSEGLWILLGIFAATGAISMAYQVLWTRAYVIILGSSTYSFTIVLTAVLLGLGSGSALGAPIVSKIRRPLYWLGFIQSGVAGSALLSFFVLDNLPRWLFERLNDTIHSAGEIYLYYFFLVGLVVLIPMILQGLTFPIVIRGIIKQRDQSGRDVGRAYAYNTFGAIAGSFAAGFVFMPWIGLETSITLTISLNIAVAATAGLLAYTEDRDTRLVGVQALAIALITGTLLAAPGVNPIALTRGMFRVYWARELYDEESFEGKGPELAFYEDGLTATVTVEKRPNLTTLKANGKPEASDGGDMPTQILVGLFPMLARSGWEDAEVGDEDVAMVGYGSGVTAGATLQWPVDRLDVAEIEQAMIPASRHFNHVNNKPLQDDRLKIYETDGRNFLSYIDRKYDVIISEPSNPWVSGVSALFTVDHFENVKRRLAPNGLFAQWVQIYEMRPKNVKRIFATIREVFPHIQAFSSKPQGTDLIVLAAKKPISFPLEGYARAWDIESVAEEMERGGIEHPQQMYGQMFMNGEKMTSYAQGVRLNTYDNGLLEYSAPKDVILYKKSERYFADRYYDRAVYGDIRSVLDRWPLTDKEGPLTEREANLTAGIARAKWIGGKVDFSEQIVEDLVDRIPPDLRTVEPPLNEFERMYLAHRSRKLELDDVLVREWPTRGSELHKLVAGAIQKNKKARLRSSIERIKSTEEYDQYYTGEHGLAYAFALLTNEYYHHAEKQLDILKDEEQSEILDSLPYLLLRGLVKQKQLDFSESYRAYLQAGKVVLNRPESKQKTPKSEDNEDYGSGK
jgi:spermidine synthase